jgi:hypothetical protein
MAYKQKVPKAITVRGVTADTYWWLVDLAPKKHQSLSGLICSLLDEARRQAELPGHALGTGDQFRTGIAKYVAEADEQPDVPKLAHPDLESL